MHKKLLIFCRFSWQTRKMKAVYHTMNLFNVDVTQKALPADIDLGIMVEIPSAALMADLFAAEIDFFSIGTNDLTQYTLAMDRNHPVMSKQADGLDPAVLRLIDRTCRAAKDAGKWVGVCGELAADPAATAILVGLGVDELSVNVNALPGLKARIRSLSKEDAIGLAHNALSASSAADVRKIASS